MTMMSISTRSESQPSNRNCPEHQSAIVHEQGHWQRVAVKEAVTLVFCATRQDFSRSIPHFAEKRIRAARDKGNYAARSIVDVAPFIVEAARTDKIAQPSLPNPNSQGAASTDIAEPCQFRIDDSLTPAYNPRQYRKCPVEKLRFGSFRAEAR